MSGYHGTILWIDPRDARGGAADIPITLLLSRRTPVQVPLRSPRTLLETAV
jgi:hypothetical protein